MRNDRRLREDFLLIQLICRDVLAKKPIRQWRCQTKIGGKKWPGQTLPTLDADFRIHEGQTLAGVLGWDRGASKGTTDGREGKLALKNR